MKITQHFRLNEMSSLIRYSCVGSFQQTTTHLLQGIRVQNYSNSFKFMNFVNDFSFTSRKKSRKYLLAKNVRILAASTENLANISEPQDPPYEQKDR